MPNILQALKSEISRLSRKEAKGLTSALKRSSAQYRRDIAALKREMATMRKTVSLLGKRATRVPAATEAAAAKGLRFVAKGFKSMRAKLGVSAADLGKLLGVSGLTVYNWESGKARPRQRHLPTIAAIRSLGKREIATKLAELAPPKKASTRAKRTKK
jgi:DNA-binding transcriptional regulator YiaG